KKRIIVKGPSIVATFCQLGELRYEGGTSISAARGSRNGVRSWRRNEAASPRNRIIERRSNPCMGKSPTIGCVSRGDDGRKLADELAAGRAKLSKSPT